MSPETDKIIDKLQKLKAMAEGAEAIGSEEEAQAFAAMFQKLLLKHKISMTDIEYSTMEKDEPVGTHRIERDDKGGYAKYPDVKIRPKRVDWIETLAGIVAEAHFCRILIHPRSSRISLVGRPSDCAVAEYMFITLHRAVEKIAAKAHYDWGTEVFRRTGSRDGPERYGFKKAFIQAFIARLAQRYRDELKATTGPQSSSTALVRVNKAEAAVREFMGRFTREATGLQRNTKFHPEGTRRGRNAADAIDLTGKAVTGGIAQKRLG